MKTSLAPRPSSCSSAGTSSSMPSVSNNENGQNDGQDTGMSAQDSRDPANKNAQAANNNTTQNADERPHAPVAKLLNESEKHQPQQLSDMKLSGAAALLPPRSPSIPSSSPPTIISSPNMTSPHIPAAPPTTPATHNQINTNIANNNEAPLPPLPPLPTLPPHIDPHTQTLHTQTLQTTHQTELNRIHQLTTHESSHYTTLSEYTHALARERRYSLSLALQLAHYKFLSRYQSCELLSDLEMGEEARMNRLFKGIDTMKRDMTEEKGRVVMELEREEERLLNGLMERLEDVQREKRMLEERVYCGGGGGLEGEMRRRGGERLGGSSLAQDATNTTPAAATTTSAAAATASSGEANTSSSDAFSCVKEDEDEAIEEDEDDEEESFNEEILEGCHHDAEMEEELEKMLQLKEAKKEESG